MRSEDDPGQDVPRDLGDIEARQDIPDQIGGQQQEAEGHRGPGICGDGEVAEGEERQQHEEDDEGQGEDADHGAISPAVRSTCLAREGLTNSFTITAISTVVTTTPVSSVEPRW